MVNSGNVNSSVKSVHRRRRGRIISTTLLHVAVLHFHVDVMVYLLQIGADADKRDAYERTPLDILITKNREEVSVLYTVSICSC